MHLSDALISTPVAAVTLLAAASLLVVAVRRSSRGLKQQHREQLVPLMGVMGAFVFAAQLINFAIPGTGSSGHLTGGILLASLLGPWAAFVTLSSVIILQSLLFADGGLMALGANIINMAAMSTLVAWPLVFRPLMRRHARPRRIFAVSVAASVTALLLGALAVVVETEASDITALPTGRFLLFMLPIHLVIGSVEGVATGAVLLAIRRRHPELVIWGGTPPKRCSWSGVMAVVAAVAFILSGAFSILASHNPDGLEWSVLRTAGEEPEAATDAIHLHAASLQESTTVAPDYDTSLAGVIGCSAILLVAAGGARIHRSLTHRR